MPAAGGVAVAVERRIVLEVRCDVCGKLDSTQYEILVDGENPVEVVLCDDHGQPLQDALRLGRPVRGQPRRRATDRARDTSPSRLESLIVDDVDEEDEEA